MTETSKKTTENILKTQRKYSYLLVSIEDGIAQKDEYYDIPQ